MALDLRRFRPKPPDDALPGERDYHARKWRRAWKEGRAHVKDWPGRGAFWLFNFRAQCGYCLVCGSNDFWTVTGEKSGRELKRTCRTCHPPLPAHDDAQA